jgi:hypothetical protein
MKRFLIPIKCVLAYSLCAPEILSIVEPSVGVLAEQLHLTQLG